MYGSGLSLFRRWLIQQDFSGDRASAFLTLATLIVDDDSFLKLVDDVKDGGLDEALLGEIFSTGEPADIVEVLSSRIGRAISATLFKKTVVSILSQSSDIDILSRVMFVAGLYLDRHPNEFVLPRELSETLLASADMDQRLGGLKALRHSGTSLRELVRTIVITLRRKDEHEQGAGLSLLTQLLIDQQQQVCDIVQGDIGRELRNELIHTEEVAKTDYVRFMATDCLARLKSAT